MGRLNFYFGYLNRDFPRHIHNCYEFHYILKGNGYFFQNGKKIKFNGDLLFVSKPDTEHTLIVENDVTFFYIQYVPDINNELDLKKLKDNYQLTPDSRVLLSKLQTLLSWDEFSRKGGENLFLYFLMSLLSNKKVEQFSQEPVIKSQNYMMDNLSNRITLDELSNVVKLDKHYYCRMFKKNTNMSPMAYFEKLKMEAACSLLNQGNLSYIVAEKLGFCDETYFSSRFKKIIGKTPGEFKKKPS